MPACPPPRTESSRAGSRSRRGCGSGGCCSPGSSAAAVARAWRPGWCPGVELKGALAALLVAALRRDRQRDPAAAAGGAAAAVHARARLPARCCSPTPGRCCSPHELFAGRHPRRLLRRRAAGRARDGRREHRPADRARHQRRRRVLAARDAADRPAARQRSRRPTPPGSSSSRSTASRCRCCAARCSDGSAPAMASWIADRGYRLSEWETDLSSQTGASQAALLLGSNEDIPAFRWVEKEYGTADRVLRRRPTAPRSSARHSTGDGLLADGGASRGNLLSGDAEETILTVSRTDAEKRANPGYRAFLANGFNVTRALVLFFWEVGARADREHARAAPRRAPARPPRRRLPVHARGDVRDRARPRRVRRADRHDARPARRLRDVRELRRGRPPLRPGARRHARGAAQARPAVRAASSGRAGTRRGPTRSSCSPTTARPRAPPSCSATATGSRTSSSGRCRTRRA